MMAEATVKRLPGITGVYNCIEAQSRAPVAKLDEEANLLIPRLTRPASTKTWVP